jgi:mannose-6-phosphate isomerase
VDTPLRFRPYLRPMVWGGRRLGEALGKALPTADNYGESWEISDHALHRSVVDRGPAAGRTLRDLMEREPAALVGAGGGGIFPWLVKYLDACDWLSVQVHPDENTVGRLWPGEGPKTEAWFVVSASPSSRIYAGLLPGVDEKELRKALATGTVADCLHTFQPRAGDCLFLRAGTVHAVGGGVLLAEVQQTSDATFRLFDWNRRDAEGRSRTLHVEEALACIDWRAGPVQPVRAVGTETGAGRQPLVACRYFHLDHVQQAEPWAVGGTGRMQVLLVLHGRGRLHGRGQPEALATGDSVLLPASLPRLECEPEGPMAALLATLPADATDCRLQIAD